MRKTSKPESIFLFLSTLTGSLWTGAYLLRIFLLYWMFEPKDFILKPHINESNIAGILYSLIPALTTTMLVYVLFIISFIFFLLTTKLKFKQNGWLFISALIVFVTLPFEVYLMTIDFNIVQLLLAGSFNSSQIVQMIVKRFNVLGNFSIVELFSYFSIIYFIIFQPLTKKNDEA